MKRSRNVRNYFRIAAQRQTGIASEIKTRHLILGLLPIITFMLGFGGRSLPKQAHRLQ
jgi:hypothetical protein